MSRTPALAAVALFAAVALSACAPSEGGATGPISSGGAPATVLERPTRTILSSNSTAQLGTVVVDGLGYTLYRFDGDSAQPPRSTCEGACAETWVPVPASTEPIKLEGVQKDDVGTVQRPDGQMQVTIGGWPVYRHAPDEGPGATDGHGADGRWFAVTPDGDKAKAS